MSNATDTRIFADEIRALAGRYDQNSQQGHKAFRAEAFRRLHQLLMADLTAIAEHLGVASPAQARNYLYAQIFEAAARGNTTFNPVGVQRPHQPSPFNPRPWNRQEN